MLLGQGCQSVARSGFEKHRWTILTKSGDSISKPHRLPDMPDVVTGIGSLGCGDESAGEVGDVRDLRWMQFYSGKCGAECFQRGVHHAAVEGVAGVEFAGGMPGGCEDDREGFDRFSWARNNS